jgi:RNA polymerase sigma factor (sigma-70 family)
MEGRYEERLAALKMLDDVGLVDRALKGQASAFRILVERHQVPLRTWLNRVATQGEDSDDLAQKAFIKAWDNLRRWNRTGTFRSWLFGIANNVAKDSYRQDQRTRLRDDRWASETTDSLTNPANSLDTGIDVENVLVHLDPIQRKIIMMSHGAGFSHQEISDALSLPLGSVKSHIARARQHILVLMQDAPSKPSRKEADNAPDA